MLYENLAVLEVHYKQVLKEKQPVWRNQYLEQQQEAYKSNKEDNYFRSYLKQHESKQAKNNTKIVLEFQYLQMV